MWHFWPLILIWWLIGEYRDQSGWHRPPHITTHDLHFPFTFHERSSSIKACLLSKFVFYQRLSLVFIKLRLGAWIHRSVGLSLGRSSKNYKTITTLYKTLQNIIKHCKTRLISIELKPMKITLFLLLHLGWNIKNV